jgi:pimeloyl-ACP methyl ester carboxylesterase
MVHWHDGGSGPPLLLLNGWTASGLAWPAAFVASLERTFRVVRVDNRGTGWSRASAVPFTIADLADDVAAVLDALELPRATVLGLSMGGMIAQELAMRHRARVERLFLVATRPPAPSQVPPAPGLARTTMARPSGPIDAHLRALWAAFCAPGFADAHPEMLDELVHQLVTRVTPRFGVAAQARAMAGWHGANRLARIDVETTVVHGDADELMPVGNGMRLAQLIPKARYVELAGVGHLVPLEAPEVLLDVVGGRTTRQVREGTET